MDKPSYLTSTFSLATLVVVIGFTAVGVWTKDMGSLKDVTLLVLGAYGATKWMNNNGAAKPTEAPKP